MTGLRNDQRGEFLRGGPAVVSGAGSGIGSELAKELSSRLDMRIAVTDIDLARAEATAAAIRSSGGHAHALRVDVADWQSVAAAADYVDELWGPARLVVCNAGVEHTGLMWTTSSHDWRRVQDINVTGSFHLARAFLPLMVESNQGHVLFVSSVGGLSVGPSQSAYLVSKHAVRALGQCVMADLKSQGSNVGVSVLLPGSVRTRILADACANDDEAELFRRKMERKADRDGMSPEEVAAMTVEAVYRGQSWIYPNPERAKELLARFMDDLTSTLE